MRIKIWIFLIINNASLAFGLDTEVGNGGLGVVHANKIYLFDFFESGLTLPKTTPYSAERRISYENQLKNNLDPSQFPLTLISQKLTHLSMKFPIAADVLSVAIQLYRWQISFDFLTPIDTTGLEVSGPFRFQFQSFEASITSLTTFPDPEIVT